MAPKALPANARVANLAWGWANGGKEASVDFADAVIVDINQDVSTIKELRDKGKYVICYFSAGSLETFRADTSGPLKDKWNEAALGKLENFENERWLDISKFDVLTEVMEPRFQLAKSKGCDGVEPDVVDCYLNEVCYENLAGAPSQEEAKALQVRYNQWQVDTAHSLDLGIGLKNSQSLIPIIGANYDFAISESCLRYGDCDQYQTFLDANKAVFLFEYTEGAEPLCEPCASFVGSACVPDELASRRLIFTKYCDGEDAICQSGSWGECYVDLDGIDYTAYVEPKGLSGVAVAFILLGIAVVVSLGAWRCTKLGPKGSATSDDRSRPVRLDLSSTS